MKRLYALLTSLGMLLVLASCAPAPGVSDAQSGPQLACPYCGNRHCFMCCVCGKLTCYDGNSCDGREITCGNCGASLRFAPRSDPSQKIQFSGVSGSGQG